MLDNGDEPFLVFAHHKAVLDGIERGLRQRNASFMRIDGATPPSQRQENVNAFQRGDARVALLSITAGGTGLTLTRASSKLCDRIRSHYFFVFRSRHLSCCV
jgi:SWI/SNF-related matrix-associated actin-dependent regulator 1 of chromatin subfamily A